MGEWWRPTTGGIEVFVRVQPGARQSEVTGVIDGRLRVRLAAPPVDGKANAALVKFIAAIFGVRPSAVSVLVGHRAREKVLLVEGPSVPPELEVQHPLEPVR